MMLRTAFAGALLFCWTAALLPPASHAQAPGGPDAAAARVTLSPAKASDGSGALSPPRATADDDEAPPRLELIPIDTLLYVDNRGATRILVNLNGHRFKLVTDPAEVEQSKNAFLIPRSGTITINIAAFMHPDESNYIALSSQGAAGTEAEIVVSPVPIRGQEVAYAITELQELPAELDLLASYPNPFRDRTTITYEIPEGRTSGVEVRLAIYDVRGRRVRVLVDDRRYPGRFPLTWDGTGAGGEPLASGIYFCRLTAGELRQTITMVLVR